MILGAPAAERITLTELARQENVAPSTTWRWATSGVKHVRLPTVLVGSASVTTRDAFVTWCEHLTTLAGKKSLHDDGATQLRHDEESRVASAEAELVALGLKIRENDAIESRTDPRRNASS